MKITKTLPPWRSLWERKLKETTDITLARGTVRYLTTEAIRVFVDAAAALAPHAEKARELNRHVEGLSKKLREYEQKILAALAGGAKVHPDSPFKVHVEETPKRVVWNEAAVGKVLERIRTKAEQEINEFAFLTYDQRLSLRVMVDELTKLQDIIELAVREGWVGGINQNLEVQQREVATPVPMPAKIKANEFTGL